ncbi:MAG TPA: ribose-5-phosphate isomerase RpiA [Acetobacteraceae bacterium]|nr:ribose-5-phosphate isomerase RpiA [Acetobacteraceae bacterium]
MSDNRTALKRVAAEAAVELVQDDMVVGLGTGSTAALAIEALIRRVREGLRIVGIPTSEQSAAQARAGGIPLVDFTTHTRIDLTIDGADEIRRDTLDLIKGLGGALLREKIVAAASARLVIVADSPKLVATLGETAPVPVEVVSFGWQATATRIEALGAEARLRARADGEPFVTDNGNLILDARFGQIADAPALESALHGIVGVVETGLFIRRANLALVAGESGVNRFEPQ